MELKEIVNLRKLREYYDNSLDDELCDFCPCRFICNSYKMRNSMSLCLIEKILDIENDNRDLYDLEADGELNPNYQINPMKNI